MILIAVLGVLGILLTMILNLSADSSFADQVLQRVRSQDRAYYVAVSAAQSSLTVFKEQDNSVHWLQDEWAQENPDTTFDGYRVHVRIVDEERFFNPNFLLNEKGQDDDDRIRVFKRILVLAGQQEELTNAVLDWLDSDSTKRQPGGAEVLDYPARRPKNGPLDSVEELNFVQGWNQRLMNGHEEMGKEVPGLRDVLTVHSTGTVNLNTAHPFVLRALAPNLDENAAEAILAARIRQPFKSLDDVAKVPGVSQDQLYYLKKFGTVNSTSWRVEVVVSSVDAASDATRLRLRATYRKAAKGFKPLAWNLDEIGPAEATASPTPFSASPRPSPRPSGSLFTSPSPRGPSGAGSRGDSSVPP